MVKVFDFSKLPFSLFPSLGSFANFVRSWELLSDFLRLGDKFYKKKSQKFTFFENAERLFSKFRSRGVRQLHVLGHFFSRFQIILHNTEVNNTYEPASRFFPHKSVQPYWHRPLHMWISENLTYTWISRTHTRVFVNKIFFFILLYRKRQAYLRLWKPSLMKRSGCRPVLIKNYLWFIILFEMFVYSDTPVRRNRKLHIGLRYDIYRK